MRDRQVADPGTSPDRKSRGIIFLLLLLAGISCSNLAQAQEPALELLVDPAPANQLIPAVFSYEASVGVWGDIIVTAVDDDQVVFSVPTGCGFICPGAREYHHKEFAIPALAPGDYTLRFVNSSNNQMASFPLSVSIGVSAAEPIRLYPPEPTAYEPFLVEILVGDSSLPPPLRQATLTLLHEQRLVDSTYVTDIRIDHLLPGFTQPGIADSIVIPVEGLGPGVFSLSTYRREADGNTAAEHTLDFTIGPMPRVHALETLWQPVLDRYFLSTERLSLQMGEAPTPSGDGWETVPSDYFPVWRLNEAVPAAVPVCRFHAPQADSWFFTVGEAECSTLQQPGTGWGFEGTPFSVLRGINRACPGHSLPVWRLYNKGVGGSNHHYTVRAGVYHLLLERGWQGEGLVFCAPNGAPEGRWRDYVFWQPAFVRAGEPVTAILRGFSPYYEYAPQEIETQRIGDQVRIMTDLADLQLGFSVPSSFEEEVSLGTFEAGEYVLQYSGEGNRFLDEQPLTVYEAVPAIQAYTFYHAGIDHFFVTANPTERDLVLADGWHSVDEGFKVWPAAGPAPNAAEPVCRFYSSLVNSHFYTAGANECAMLQSSNSGWTYEGIAFQALVPKQGVCAPGTEPVWRMFNNRHYVQDSNHRFLTSRETYRSKTRARETDTLISDRWAGEGVAFCSPME